MHRLYTWCNSPHSKLFPIYSHTTPHPNTATPKKPSDKPSCLFQSLEFFITRLALGDIEAATQCYTSPYSSVHTPREEEEYNRAKCAVLLRVLKLVAVLLTRHPKEAFSVSGHSCVFTWKGCRM